MRCYNGCPDSELKTYLQVQESYKQAITAAGYSVTWFPMEEKWLVFKGYHAVSPFLNTLAEAAAYVGTLSQRKEDPM